MKKNFLFLFLVIGGILQAQEVSNRISFAIGYEPDGILVRGGYSQGYDEHIFTVAAQANFESYTVGAFDNKVNAQQYLLNAGYYYEFLELNGRDFVFSGGGGGIIGYENIPNTILDDGGSIESQSGVVYGGFLGINAEKYIMPINRSAALGVLLDVRYNYFIQSELGSGQLNVAIGVRYTY